ncbi:kinesin-like protein [Tupanvirus deep ocean]|uniref:Kinesin-like protein n=2 Tax=Tupanvirus TaxID=2094720 RepID=A0AC62A7Y1_9VIRU|nr:kinesin-like protein [Tupanvirus deep ocean]QKU33778.1 kinesin-like protein [Tupanvirus deep ocean]
MSGTLIVPDNFTTGIPSPINPVNAITFKIGTTLGGKPTIETNEKDTGVKDGLSHYQVDYILLYFDALMTQEMNRNPDVIYNVNFQEFMQWLMEFKRIVIEARNSPLFEAVPPVQSGDTTPKKYSCDTGHKFSEDITNQLKIAITVGVGGVRLNPRQYYTEAQLATFGFPSPGFGYAYYGLCSQPETVRLYTEVIDKARESYEKYVNSLVPPDPQPIENILDKLHGQFTRSLAEINDQISNGDYRTRYDIIETKLRDTLGFLDDLTAATNTEINIVQHSTNVEDFYENVDFNEKDIDPALVIPKDTIDLVERKQIKKELNTAISKYSKMASAKVLANTYNIATGIKAVANVAALGTNLLNTLTKGTNIQNPSQELLDLMQTKIYVDPSGNKTAEYLDAAGLETLKNRQLRQQKEYLDRITTNVDEVYNGVTGKGRTSRYDVYKHIEYRDITLAGGNPKKKNKNKETYMFKEKTTQRITPVQTGGVDINVERLIGDGGISKNRIDDLENQINTVNELYDTQNKAYFENEDFLSLDNLQQKNEFLIEMMNLFILHNFLIGEKSAEHSRFFSEIKTKMSDFRKNLSNIWDVMKAKIDTGSVDSAVIDRLLANGTVTISEIQTLLTSIGLNPSSATVDIDEIINNADRLKLLDALGDRYGGVTNISMIANDLYRILNTKVAPATDKSKSLDELYSGLYKYYSTLKSLNSSLMAQYRSLDESTLDMEKLRQFSGDVIESNLTTTNTFIRVLISVLQNFTIKINSLKDIRLESRASKRRLNDFETYVKESKFQLRTYDKMLTARHGDIVQNNSVYQSGFDADYIIDFYDNYVTNYLTKMVGASANVVKYFSYDKDLRYVNEKKYTLEKNQIEFDVAASGVYTDLHLYNGTGPAPTPKISGMTTDPTTLNMAGPTWNNLTTWIINNPMDRFNGVTAIPRASWIPLFPHLLRRLNIPAHVNTIISTFSAPRPDTIKAIMGRYIKFGGTPGPLLPYPGMKKSEQHALMNSLVSALRHYISVARVYGNLASGIKLQGADNDFARIDTELINLQDQFYNTKTDDDLRQLYDFINSTNFIPYDVAKIQNNMAAYLQQVYTQLGFVYSAAPADIANLEKFRDLIVDEFNTFASTLLELFNEKLQEKYQILNGMILINNATNPNFQRIQRTQRDAARLNILTSVIALRPRYNDLANVSDRLLPTIGGVLGAGNHLVNANFNNIITVPNNLHNLINTKNGGIPYLLEDARPEKRPIFNSIRDDFRAFDNMAAPLLSLMKRILDNGITLTNNAGPINFSTSRILSDDVNHYSGPFIYDDTSDITLRKVTAPAIFPYIITYTNRNDPNIMKHYLGGATNMYITNYIDDTMETDGTHVFYTVETDKDIRFLININNRTFPLIIANAAPITVTNINQAIMILNTARYLIDFMNRFNEIVDVSKNLSSVDIIKNLSVENASTWNKPVTQTDTLYGSRLDKQTNLRNIMYILERIESTIRNNIGNYYFLNELLLEAKDATNVNAIMNARMMVEAADPKSGLFNATIDKIWIFARKIIHSWYSVFGYMLSKFILMRTVEKLMNLIESLGTNATLDPTTIINLGSFQPIILASYSDTADVRSELNNAISIISRNQNEYPININFSPGLTGSDAKYMIPNESIDALVFDQFYNNLGTPSQKAYVMLALLHRNIATPVRNSLTSVQNISNRIVNIVDAFEPYLDQGFIVDKINTTVTGAAVKHVANEFNTITNNFANNIFTEIRTKLLALGLNNVITDINNNINTFITTILGMYIKGPIPRVPNDPRIFPNRMMNPYGAPGSPVLKQNMVNIATVPWTPTMETPLQYNFMYNNYLRTAGTDSVRDYVTLLMTDIYGIIFNSIGNEIIKLMKDVSTEMANVKVTAIYNPLQIAYRLYFNNKNINNIYPVKPFTHITDPGATNDNDINVKIIIFAPDVYVREKVFINDIFDVFDNVTSTVKSNLHTFYNNEIDNYRRLIELENQTISDMNKNKLEIQERNQKLKNIVDTVSQVMFNEHYKTAAFVDNTRLINHVTETVDNYETIWRMIEQKIHDIITKNNHHVLTLAQINNYQAFKSTVNKLIKNTAVVNKFYRRMSFGLIEYYYDVMNTILHCLDGNAKTFENMTKIESYLYEYHYIQLKRCHQLFKWIRHEYQPMKQQQDDAKRKAKQKFTPILKHKIEPLLTLRDVNIIFVEFQGLRRYLDDYSAVVMDKVQLHMRINDFVSDVNNPKIEDLAKTKGVPINDVDFLMDWDPDSDEYQTRWDTGKLLFVNKKDSNILHVNFNLLRDIYAFENPGIPIKDYDVYYNSVFTKMQGTNPGIDFERIYNTRIYPDSDVISNYMSIAPNITNGKGTVIMTYGYSGVGKSASLFGKQKPVPSNGILQATLEQFTDVDIYFRVFEIYGLGTQYNYYWNPENAGGMECYPNFTQAIIHHVVDASNPTVLKSVDQLVFTNRHDMLNYIMDLANPKNGTKFAINADDKENLGGKRGLAQYYDIAGGNLTMKNTTYVKINSEHYRNFTTFVKSVDAARSNGVEILKLLRHVAKQIKGTINNPESSRSILVYDFEINLDPKSRNPIFVPFLIYDLPGKEDIYRTYVNSSVVPTDPDASRKARAFKDIPNDIAKERKSTYVTNPLLIPIFDDNAEVIKQIMVLLSRDPSSALAYGGTAPPAAKFDLQMEKDLVDDIKNYNITTFSYPASTGHYFTDDSANYDVASFYQNPATVTNFAQLFDINNFRNDLNSAIPLLVDRGLIGTDAYLRTGAAVPKDIVVKELTVLICVILIAYLIKYQLFDLLVEIIYRVADRTNVDDKPDNGGWSRAKIYAFFEAYYINENVVGLLQYLINRILNKSSSIALQDTINERMPDTINKNYKTANRYRAINNLITKFPPTNKVANNYDLKVNTELLDSKGDILKQREITDFVTANSITVADGIFATFDTPLIDASRKMANVVSFENKGKYDSNKIFRSGDPSFICNAPGDTKYIINPRHAVKPGDPAVVAETNRPLLQDFLEPYEQKIAFYYMFYVVSNTQVIDKAEEQVKLLNNSMPFIKEMDPSTKMGRCAS